MVTAAFYSFWADFGVRLPRDVATPEPPRKCSAPVFIGDAVQPHGAETLLLSILRRTAQDHDAEPDVQSVE